mmetsp:Transcript_29353/g.53223  ORF Transcript_29353/g.53223 Transcript_29353/m.53223 type:complete len:318 (+) Transcript_29353:103-1056(+)
MSTTVETTTAPEISSFLAGVSASFLLKLTTSVDDLVWFSPFLAMSTSTPQRLKYCCVYAIVCVIVAVAALCLARAAELGFDAVASAIASDDGDNDNDRERMSSFWDASTVLSLFASAIIFIYALVELRGWINEGNELPSISMDNVCSRITSWCSRGNSHHGGGGGTDDSIEFTEFREDNSGDEKVTMTMTKPVEIESAMINEDNDLEEPISISSNDNDNNDDEVQATILAASKSTYALFAVALCGTLDDLILFAAIVAGRGIPWTSVVPGSILAALVVLVVCWHISLYEPFANFVRRVPMWALLGGISMYLFVGVFL